MTQPAQWRKGPRPDPSVIEFLESLQVAARKGQIRAISVSIVNPMLKVETGHAGDMDHVKRHLLASGHQEAALKLHQLGS